MRLEEYWGIGPKTSSRLREELGQEQAIKAIENADIRTLTQAGLSRGRVTRILRHTNNSEGLDILATKDTREIYKSILDIACSFAVTDQASDRIRVLTPLQNISAMQNRLDRVMDAAATLNDLSADEKEQIMEAFDKYERQEDNTQASIKTALSLYEIGVMQGPFSPLSELDIDALTEAYEALQYLQNDHVQEGADDRLDGLRNRLSEIKAIDQNTNQVLEAVQSETIRGTDEFRE
ncbi:MAG: DNA mismatch repair protein, partial [Halobacteriaceae archaeon]